MTAKLTENKCMLLYEAYAVYWCREESTETEININKRGEKKIAHKLFPQP